VAEKALQLLADLGALYEADNHEDMKRVLTYLPQDAHGVGWLEQGSACAVMWGVGETPCGNAMRMPPPFTARPSVGTRRLVAANFGHIAFALAQELRSWQLETRVAAAKLLKARFRGVTALRGN